MALMDVSYGHGVGGGAVRLRGRVGAQRRERRGQKGGHAGRGPGGGAGSAAGAHAPGTLQCAHAGQCCLWCAFGVPLVCLWCAFHLPLVCLWCASGVPLVCLWCAFGVPHIPSSAFGVPLVCLWCACGVPISSVAFDSRHTQPDHYRLTLWSGIQPSTAAGTSLLAPMPPYPFRAPPSREPRARAMLCRWGADEPVSTPRGSWSCSEAGTRVAVAAPGAQALACGPHLLHHTLNLLYQRMPQGKQQSSTLLTLGTPSCPFLWGGHQTRAGYRKMKGKQAEAEGGKCVYSFPFSACPFPPLCSSVAEQVPTLLLDRCPLPPSLTPPTRPRYTLRCRKQRRPPALQHSSVLV